MKLHGRNLCDLKNQKCERIFGKFRFPHIWNERENRFSLITYIRLNTDGCKSHYNIVIFTRFACLPP